MKNNKEIKISYWAAHLTTVVSVTLVLLIIGIIGLITISASEETHRLREKLEVNVVLADSIPNVVASTIAERISKKKYVNSVAAITKEQAMQNWKNDTGEDLENLFGVNPLSPEIALTLKSDYASADSLKILSKEISEIPGVETVVLPDPQLVENMNRNIEFFTMILGGIALILIVISFALINNTVHLSVYSRRFTIHTMQLVGATDRFIRRPFLSNNMLAGIIAGLLASGILALSLAAAPKNGDTDVASYISWEQLGIVAGSLVIAGALLCRIAAWISTTRYLRKDYEELFR